MPVPIAELFVSVGADVNAAVAGLTAVGTELTGLSNQFNAAKPAALALTAAGVGIGAAFAGAVNVAADFESQMAGVRAVMSPTEANNFGAALSDLAIKLGRDTVFTSREAAAGIEELIKNGISATDVLGGAGDAAIALAAATGIDVAGAATVASQAMNAFGLKASDMTATVDILAGVANASAADINDLRFGLEVTGAVASSLGVDFANTAEALGLLTNAGLTGQVAGTSLRQMLLELTPTTKPAQEEFKKLGLTTATGANIFFDATGKLKDLADVSQILQDATKGMSDQQRTAAFNILFTRDAISAATIFARDGAEGVNTLRDSMGGITAASTAATRLDSFRGALQNLGGSIETVQILVGNLFLPTLRSIADATRGVVDSFSQLTPAVQRGAVIVAGISGVLALALGGFVLLAPAIAALPAAFGALIGVLGTFAPLLLVAAAAFLTLRAAWENNVGGIQAIAGAFSNLGDVLQAALSGDIAGAWAGLVEDIKTIDPAVRGAIDGVEALLGHFQNLGDIVTALLSGRIADAFQSLVLDITGVNGPLGVAIVTIGDFIGHALDMAGVLGGEVKTQIENFATLVLPLLNVGAQTVITFWNEQLLPAIQNPGPVLDEFGASIERFAASTGKLAQTGAQGSPFQAIFDFFANFDTIKTQVESLGPLASSIGDFAASLEHLNEALFGLQGQQFSDLGTAIQNFVNLVAPAQPALAGIGETIGTLGQTLQGVTDFFHNAATAIEELATAIDKLNAGGTVQLPFGLGQATGTLPAGVNGPQEGTPGAQLTVPPAVAAPLVAVGQLIISSEAEGQAFLARMASAVAGAANRVNPPPDNTGFPALQQPANP